MFIYVLALTVAFSYIVIPFIAIIRSSVTLSNFLIFTGFIGNRLQKKRINIRRKVVSKTTYLRISFLMQFFLGLFLALLSLFLFSNSISYYNIFILLCFGLFGSILIGTSLNRYLVIS